MTLEAEHLRIVPAELWARVQARLAQSGETFKRVSGGRFFARASGQDHASPYLMTGILRCSECGATLGGIPVYHGNGPTATRTKVEKYSCSYRRNRGPEACSNGISIRTEAIDTAIVNAITSLVSPDMITEAIGRALEIVLGDTAGLSDQREALEREIAQAEKRTSNLVAALAGGTALEAIKSGLEAEEAKKATLRESLAKLPAAMPSVDVEAIKAKLAAVAVDIIETLATPGPMVRTMLRKLITSPIKAEPVTAEDGRKGYRLTGAVSYLGLLDGEVHEILNLSSLPESVAVIPQSTNEMGVAPTGNTCW
jgi:site-specific DNA recombinase